MNQKPTISAIILTKNEEARILPCLLSVDWADETIVVDNGSTDATCQLAEKQGSTVITDTSGDFSEIRSRGAKEAHGQWLLYVDADEIVTPHLRDEIRKAVLSVTYDAYFIPRKNFYLGVEWPFRDGMVRLMKKNNLVAWKGVLHEHAKIKGKTGKLKEPFLHYTHRSLEEMVAKTNAWSVDEAVLRYNAHHPPVSWWRLLRVMITAFWNSFITQGGWKAGAVGWIESIYQAFSVFITYAKLWELQQKKK